MASQPVAPIETRTHRPPPAGSRSRRGGWRVVATVVLLGVIAAVAWYLGVGLRRTEAAKGHEPSASGASEGVSVDFVRPKRGGMERVSDMTGSVHAFQSANLYANLSGYLKSQEIVVDGKTVLVDIGVHVRKGDLLAVIDVPEVYAARDQAAADVEQAEAQVIQATAHIETAKADLTAAGAEVQVSEADVGRYTAGREETRKAFDRYKSLRSLNSVEQDVVDQKQSAYESAVSAEKSARASVLSANAKVAAAKAKVDQAVADKKAVESGVAVAKAKRTKAEVFVDYTKIISPYTGVITARNFFPGDYIRAASEGNTMPLLSVSRTDIMRIRTKISDLNVPYADVGDPADVTIQALPGLKLEGKVSRFSEAEIPSERTMVTEIDLPNGPESPSRGRLRDGMFGLATIRLTTPSGELTIPSSCLIGPAEGDENAVLVAIDGKARRTKVKVGRDDGREVEIVSGLADESQVIIPTGSVADGTPVVPTESTPAKPAAPAH